MSAPIFFASPDNLRRWLVANGSTSPEVWIGFYKAGSGKKGITYGEALDEALCQGWIDGLLKTIDAERFMRRFTPRRKASIWSAVNVRKIAELTVAGRMAPAGIAAFEGRDPKKTSVYSYEQANPALTAAESKAFRANRAAWAGFNGFPPSYRKVATWWVVSAKKAETRARRLATLMADSAAGRKIASQRPGKPA